MSRRRPPPVSRRPRSALCAKGGNGSVSDGRSRKGGSPGGNPVAATDAEGSPRPAIRLVRWTIVRTLATGDRYILGLRADDGRGRFSTAVATFDATRMAATTVSGSRYELLGEPSDEGMEDPLLLFWLADRDLTSRDVEVVEPGRA